MGKSLIQCLEEDYRRSFERVFDRLYFTVPEDNDPELPPIRMKYMVDDYPVEQDPHVTNQIRIIPLLRTR